MVNARARHEHCIWLQILGFHFRISRFRFVRVEAWQDSRSFEAVCVCCPIHLALPRFSFLFLHTTRTFHPEQTCNSSRSIVAWYSLRWIVKILHDPRYLTPWESWHYSVLGSCRIFSINGTHTSRVLDV